MRSFSIFYFFFNDPATTEIYTLSLHDALPIFNVLDRTTTPMGARLLRQWILAPLADKRAIEDRKSTRLNSSHGYISYAVFCLKKKKPKPLSTPPTVPPPATNYSLLAPLLHPYS